MMGKNILNSLLWLFIVVSLSACSCSNFVTFESKFDMENTSDKIEKNIFAVLGADIWKYQYPTDNKKTVCYFGSFDTSVIEKKSPNNQRTWLIQRVSRGSFLNFMDATVSNRVERDAVIRVEKKDKTIVYISDLLSKNSICRRRGFDSHLFADELLPILYDGYTGNVDVWHDNGGKYCSGMLENGKRTGEWIWWNRKGEVMQSMTYVQGIALPELEKLKSDKETK